MQLKLLHRISDYEWLLPKHDKMNVDVYIVGSKKIIEEMDDNVYNQVKNVASLPGIIDKVALLPDAHSGYGFPIGCVAAFDKEDGIVSIGGVGFDINCGVRLITTNLIYQDIEKKVESIIKAFYKKIPAGVGANGKINLTKKELKDVIEKGAEWVIKERGMGKIEELDYIEEGGCVSGADFSALTEEALAREKNQLGTLGSGNHYLELQVVEEVFDIERARVFGLFKNQVVATLHCGSRGLGHQTGVDFMNIFAKAIHKYKISIKDKELIYVPATSPEGRRYFAAVQAASNFAFANRQVISYLVSEVLNDVIKDVDTNTMYDIGHNTLKIETHKVGNAKLPLLVHRKGSTRNFAGKSQVVPKPYQFTGQPVIVGGSMGTASYVLCGKEESMEKTFGTTIHGAGRTMSRHKARESLSYEELERDLLKRGVFLKTKSREGALEESPIAYKDIEEVVNTVIKSNLSQRVARLRPLGVLKG
ncbi:MAG: RtcB family protein [Brevinematales bacterium]|nr:RtcB family protein [Brevinematales bacterium]